MAAFERKAAVSPTVLGAVKQCEYSTLTKLGEYRSGSFACLRSISIDLHLLSVPLAHCFLNKGLHKMLKALLLLVPGAGLEPAHSFE
jgi:hypothetical protein